MRKEMMSMGRSYSFLLSRDEMNGMEERMSKHFLEKSNGWEMVFIDQRIVDQHREWLPIDD